MLNEIIEYHQYTDKIKSNRLKPRKNNLTGIKRALEIIAREFYFNTAFPPQFELTDKVNCTKDALRIWLGAEAKSSYEDFPEVEKRLDFLNANSYEKYLLGFANEENGLHKLLIKSRESYDVPELNFKSAPKKGPYNTDNKIYFDGVISNAITCGPLKRYYLVCKKTFDDLGYKEKFNGKHQDELLKGMAAYLLGRFSKKQVTAYVVQQNILCWLTGDKFLENGRGPSAKYFKNVNAINGAKSHTTKLRLISDKSGRKLSDYDFNIIDADSSRVEEFFNNKDYYVFADYGYNEDATKSLVEGQKY